MEYRIGDRWQGRVDAEDGLAGLRWHQAIEFLDLSRPLAPGRGFAFLGFASDQGVKANQGRVGAAAGPAALRAAMANLPLHQDFPIFDAGDVVCHADALPQAQQLLCEKTAQLLAAGYFPLVLGGGHETAYGHYLGYARSGLFPAVINLDAHFDLRTDERGPTSGTPFYQIFRLCQSHNQPLRYQCLGIERLGNTKALYQRADQWGVSYAAGIDYEQVQRFLPEGTAVFLSLDLDVLGSAFAPGVSAPNPFGLEPKEVRAFILWAKSYYRIIGFEVVELNPLFDLDNRTAKLAAWLIASFMGEKG